MIILVNDNGPRNRKLLRQPRLVITKKMSGLRQSFVIVLQLQTTKSQQPVHSKIICILCLFSRISQHREHKFDSDPVSKRKGGNIKDMSKTCCSRGKIKLINLHPTQQIYSGRSKIELHLIFQTKLIRWIRVLLVRAYLVILSSLETNIQLKHIQALTTFLNRSVILVTIIIIMCVTSIAQ